MLVGEHLPSGASKGVRGLSVLTGSSVVLWWSDSEELISYLVCIKVQTAAVCVSVSVDHHGGREEEDSVCGFSLCGHHQCGG